MPLLRLISDQLSVALQQSGSEMFTLKAESRSRFTLAVRDEMGPETRWVVCTWILILL
jgi:hypothetical protein